MLTRERKAHILEVLRRDRRVVAKDISRELGLSEDTIRRDLRELAGEGLLQRVHGGALPASPAMADYAGRRDVSPEGKAAIAKAAARLVRPGQVVLLDGGTTAVQLARHLPPGLTATVVTHSPSVAVELVGHAGIEVELIGGRLFKHSVVAVGTTAAAVGASTAAIGASTAAVEAAAGSGAVVARPLASLRAATAAAHPGIAALARGRRASFASRRLRRRAHQRLGAIPFAGYSRCAGSTGAGTACRPPAGATHAARARARAAHAGVRAARLHPSERAARCIRRCRRGTVRVVHAAARNASRSRGSAIGSGATSTNR